MSGLYIRTTIFLFMRSACLVYDDKSERVVVYLQVVEAGGRQRSEARSMAQRTPRHDVHQGEARRIVGLQRKGRLGRARVARLAAAPKNGFFLSFSVITFGGLRKRIMLQGLVGRQENATVDGFDDEI